MKTDQPVPVGESFGPYKILGLLGAGGMGNVYRAVDTRLGREVAVKVLRPDFMSPEGHHRFEREARLVASLSHPNIVALYDVSLVAPAFLVTELLVGETLLAKIGARRLSFAEILDWSSQIAAGVGAAHERGIVHRDLKPANVFVTREGIVKVLDFGLARHEGPTAPRDGEPLTQSGAVLGTPNYMAPEQIVAEAVDARTDVFALGLIMFEMAARRRLFTGRSSAEIMVSVLRDEPDFGELRADLFPGLREVIEKAVRKIPSERYPSAIELRSAIDAIAKARIEAAMSATVSVSGPVPAAAGRASVAVLPFTDLSAEQSLGYLCEGLVDEIMASLANVEGLRIAARSSAARYKQMGLDAAECGRRLGTETVLEGSVRMQGRQLRVTAQLTNVEQGVQVWAKRYDREVDDLFVIQEGIARAIGESLELKLAPEKSSRIDERRAESPEAYSLYLQGRHHLERRTKGLVFTGIRCFERAIALDERYAPAHAALAEAHVLTSTYGYRSGVDVHGAATSAVSAALRLAPDLAETHAASAGVKMLIEWDLVGAELAWARACELAPRWGHAIAVRAHNLAHGAQVERACVVAESAINAEPDSAYVRWMASVPFVYARRHAEALAMLDRALALDETLLPAYWTRAWSLTSLGRHDEAVASAAHATEASGRVLIFLSTLGHALGAAGRRPDAIRVLDELAARRASGEYVPPLFFANVHAGLGAVEAACDELDAAYLHRNGHLINTAVTPLHDALRGAARYESLLRRLRLMTPSATRPNR